MKSMTPAEQVAIDRVTLDEVNPQKRRTGLSRVWHALGYSCKACMQPGMKKHSAKKLYWPLCCCPVQCGWARAGWKYWR